MRRLARFAAPAALHWLMVSKAVLFCPDLTRRARRLEPGAYPHAPSAAASLMLIPIANRPLMFRALDSLEEAGITELAIVGIAGTVADLQGAVDEAEWELAISWHESVASDGFAACLRRLEAFLGDDPLVAHLGDSVTKASLEPTVRAIGAGDVDAVVLVQEEAAQGSPVVKVLPGFDGRQLAGVYGLGPAVIQVAKTIEDRHLSYDRAIITAVEALGRGGGQLETWAVDDWWRYRPRTHGRLDGVRMLESACLLDANYYMLDGLSGETAGAALVDSRVQGAVVIDPSASVHGSVVRGPALIGPGATLRDAYVGPYTSIGRGVSIDGAEIEHSVILPGATISHLGGRLEASVVGRNAKVFRDFALPRALRVNVGENATISLA
jgi:glucose-1-phosphate thymidylyltransferase